MNYTKGEWIKGSKGSIDDKGGFPIAIVYPDTRLSSKDSIAKREANAHLIAAAPDMYEALQEALGIFPGDWINQPYLVDIHIKIQQALAKAEGK
jgi:hypothetical protein